MKGGIVVLTKKGVAAIRGKARPKTMWKSDQTVNQWRSTSSPFPERLRGWQGGASHGASVRRSRAKLLRRGRQRGRGTDPEEKLPPARRPSNAFWLYPARLLACIVPIDIEKAQGGTARLELHGDVRKEANKHRGRKWIVS